MLSVYEHVRDELLKLLNGMGGLQSLSDMGEWKSLYGRGELKSIPGVT